MKKLYAVFVNYNSGEQLYKGVGAVLKSPSVTGVIIVDNGSKDKSLDYLEKIKDLKRIVLIKNKRNMGFYKALNMAIKEAWKLKADMVMPLDFDLDFSFDFISKLLKIDGDIIAPALKFKRGGKWFYDYGGRINWLTGNPTHVITSWVVKSIGAVSTSTNHDNPYWCDFVSGGCTIIKKKVFNSIGNFDEDYFVYFGDADYALKAKEAGFNVVMDGSTIVYHKQEVARETKNVHKLKISFFDNLIFIRKRIKWYFRPMAYLYILLAVINVSLRTFLVSSR